MKITVYNVKGWAGKTPIATNIILDREYALATNEPFHILDQIVPKETLLTVPIHEPFPDIPDDIDIVFDLAWSISQDARSITSALTQSDVIIIPIYNELKCIIAGLHTILEVNNFNKNIIVIATKLTKQRADKGSDWTKFTDFTNIQRFVHNKIDRGIPVLPLKFSKAFDLLFEKEKSLEWLRQKTP